jgi:hypothetical protein
MRAIVLAVGEALLEQEVLPSSLWLWPLNFGNGVVEVAEESAEKKRELEENEIYR